MGLTLDACVAQNIGDRDEQQDRVGLYQHPRVKRLILAVLADGMGGHKGGAIAAEQVVLSAKNSLDLYSPEGQQPEQLLSEALKEAHLMIRACRSLNEQDPNSTGIVLLLQPQGEAMKASWAYCGDTRLYHFRGDQPLLRTRDHSYVEQMMLKGYMTPEQAAAHPNRNVLVTSLGGEDAPLVDTGSAENLQGGDSLLLCSDGLWGHYSDAELGGVIAAFPARQAAEKLVERARQRGKGRGDNCTLVVLKLVAPPPPPLPPRFQRPAG